MEKWLNKWFTQIFLIVLLLVSILGWVATIYYFTRQDITARESVLLSLLQTIFSFFASWALTHFYAEFQYQAKINEIKHDYEANLRVYASKAAEKVDNLSAELSKLSIYLQQELDSENENLENDLLIKEEKLRSAIQIINTLKSINDKSLSDWKGIIPEEELEEIDEEREDREAKLNEIVGALKQYNDLVSNGGIVTTSDFTMREDIEALNNKLNIITRQLSANVGISPTKLNKKTSTKKVEVEKACPHCKILLKYKQRPKEGSWKKINCQECGSALLAWWDEKNGFILEEDKITNENFSCPCSQQLSVALSIFPNKSVKVNCDNCKRSFLVIKKLNSLEVKEIQQKIFSENDVLSEDLIESIKNKLPPQPWPTGTSVTIAEQTGLPHRIIRKAIDILVQRGIFKVQIDGKLYDEAVLPLKKEEISETTS